jgi:hypothetical protein
MKDYHSQNMAVLMKTLLASAAPAGAICHASIEEMPLK